MKSAEAPEMNREAARGVEVVGVSISPASPLISNAPAQCSDPGNGADSSMAPTRKANWVAISSLLLAALLILTMHYFELFDALLKGSQNAEFDNFRLEDVHSGQASLSSSSFSSSTPAPPPPPPPPSWPWAQRTLLPVDPDSAFVKYAAYRISSNQITAVGLGRFVLANETDLIQKCVWRVRPLEEGGDQPSGWVVDGDVEVVHAMEHHWWTYEVIILHCKLHGDAHPEAGGGLYLDIHGQHVLAYSESPREFVETQPHPPYLHNITHCSPPVHGNVNPHRIYEWLDFHTRMNVDHFVLYDTGGVSPELEQQLQPFLDAGTLEISNLRNVDDYRTWYHGQVLIINDCLYRFRFDSLWVMFLDYDEFLTTQPGSSLTEILGRNAGRPFISHGTLWWDIERCVHSWGDSDPRWPLERAIYHWPKIYCLHEEQHNDTSLCLDVDGHRKLFVDPRKVHVVNNHQAVSWTGDGLDLKTDVMWHNHFSGLIAKENETCTQIIEQDEPIVWWSRGTEIAEVARDAREHPLDFKRIQHEREWWVRHVNKAHKLS